MKQYEYKSVCYHAKEKGILKSGIDINQLDDTLNAFGRKGWRLCTTINETFLHDLVLVFEREVSVD